MAREVLTIGRDKEDHWERGFNVIKYGHGGWLTSKL